MGPTFVKKTCIETNSKPVDETKGDQWAGRHVARYGSVRYGTAWARFGEARGTHVGRTGLRILGTRALKHGTIRDGPKHDAALPPLAESEQRRSGSSSSRRFSISAATEQRRNSNSTRSRDAAATFSLNAIADFA
ncbi:hypothetical protein WN944_001114 [Citrus x changshan-huyou]|uniref:Uncharacterized protein n=1 Tax=Citrus x changshan-huyou TaxID=2935761 RepID=A0AAP0ME31_9ROSI